MLKSNNQEKAKLVSNTVGKKPGLNLRGRGVVNPQFSKATQKLNPNQPFIDLVSAKDRNKPRVSVGIKSGGAVMPYRTAQEGNVGLPLGGMPPPPSTQDKMSPQMVEEAKSFGIEVAPPAATAEEVADDQLVLLSEGELVVPANVVRFHGLAQYEKMRKSALAGLDEMQANGQIVSTQENPMPEGLVKPIDERKGGGTSIGETVVTYKRDGGGSPRFGGGRSGMLGDPYASFNPGDRYAGSDMYEPSVVDTNLDTNIDVSIDPPAIEGALAQVPSSLLPPAYKNALMGAYNAALMSAKKAKMPMRAVGLSRIVPRQKPR